MKTLRGLLLACALSFASCYAEYKFGDEVEVQLNSTHEWVAGFIMEVPVNQDRDITALQQCYVIMTQSTSGEVKVPANQARFRIRPMQNQQPYLAQSANPGPLPVRQDSPVAAGPGEQAEIPARDLWARVRGIANYFNPFAGGRSDVNEPVQKIPQVAVLAGEPAPQAAVLAADDLEINSVINFRFPGGDQVFEGLITGKFDDNSYIVESLYGDSQYVVAKDLITSATKIAGQVGGGDSEPVQVSSAATLAEEPGYQQAAALAGEPVPQLQLNMGHFAVIGGYTDAAIAKMNNEDRVVLLKKMVAASPFKGMIEDDEYTILKNSWQVWDTGFGEGYDTTPRTQLTLTEAFNSLTDSAYKIVQKNWTSIQGMLQWHLATARAFGGAIYPWYSSANPNDKALRILTQLNADCGFNALWNAVKLINNKYDEIRDRDMFMKYLTTAKEFVAKPDFQQKRFTGADAANKSWYGAYKGKDALWQLDYDEIIRVLREVSKAGVADFSEELETQLFEYNVANPLEAFLEMYQDMIKKNITNNKRFAFIVNLGGGHWGTICFYKDARGLVQYIFANSLETKEDALRGYISLAENIKNWVERL